MSTLPRRAGFATGDVLLILAGLTLSAALAHPRIERALVRRQADQARAAVEAVGAAVAAFQREHASWPPSEGSGEVPTDLAAYLPPGFSFRAGAFTLEWDRWEAVGALPEEAAQPRPEDVREPPAAAADSSVVFQPPVVAIGAISVGAEDERILAALLEGFGPSRSFVREGSWTLVLPPAEGGRERTP